MPVEAAVRAEGTQPAGEPSPVVLPPAPATRVRPVLVILATLGVIAVVAALYLARAFFVPLLIGILAAYALRPVIDGLHALHIPRGVGAALVLGALVGGFGWGAFSLSDGAASVVEKLPDAAREIRRHMAEAQGHGSTLRKIEEAATELQGAASEAGGAVKPVKPASRGAAAIEAQPSAWLRDFALAQSALLFSVAAQAPIVLLLTYFLLASGDHFRRKLVQVVGRSLSRKKEAVRILEEVDTQVQRYLLGVLGSNVLVGLCTWLAFAGLGMEQAGAWGAIAGVLHFIPYLGPVLFAAASAMAAFMQFGTASDALLVGGVSMIVAIAVGSLLMTWLQSRFASVNAAVLFIALLFFGWLWGIWGLLLGAPLLAIAKVICDRVEALKPVGELLGR